MKRTFASVAALFVFSALTQAQFPDSPPAFTAADVHPSRPGTNDGGNGFLPGRFIARGETMLNIIKEAYGVDGDMIFGGPNWLDSDRFDIDAKAAPTTEQATLRLMLQGLLADRFKLSIHKEDRAMPVYALTVAKRGLKLKESAEPGPPNCDGEGGGTKDITIKCQRMTMVELVQQIRQNARAYIDRPVVDQTGLTGVYDYVLSWTPKNQLKKPGADADGPAGTSIFDAVDKQLGLKLEAQQKPVAAIVIDRINQKPTDNPAGVTSKLPKEPTEFEVADVKVSAPGTKTDIQFLPGGRLDLKGVSMKLLLTIAYEVENDMVIGPKWLDTDHFDIVAKSPATAAPDTLLGMLRALLADRFKLKIHNDEQPVQVYGLVVGKRGLKLKESTGDARAGCKQGTADGKRTYTCQNTTMAQLAGKLRQQAPSYIDHPVVDLTGLKGAYDFVLAWTPKGQFQAAKDAPPSAAAPVAADPTGDVTVFEAVDRQLGLKLEAQKHPMPVIVVDHVEQVPTGN